MKKLKSLFILLFTLSMMIIGVSVAVSADTTTDLKSMKVYAVDSAGKKTEVPMEFKSTTYSYNLTVMSNTVSISIEAEPADSASKWSVEKDGINTKMDFGNNLTVVDVRSTSGAVRKYTLNTTKLTEEEESTYKAEDKNKDKKPSKKSSDDKVVKVGKKEMKIASSFDKNLIPEGFAKSSAKYDDKKYPCIKGEVKDITAFYLYNEDTEGFYIYHTDDSSFEKMSNIKIKSRMYTIVTPDTVDPCLKNYDKKNVTIIDQKVKAWVLDGEQGMYLVYAMNWDGETSLYCYDDNEKCFQRYLVDNDTNTQMEAANKAYETLQNKYNKLVSRYNVLLKILCGLVIVIIILIFIIINISLNKKEKRAKKAKESQEIDDTSDTDFVISDNTKEETEEPEIKDPFDRTYGDEPTFGIDKLDFAFEEGFYGGEIEEEDDVLIDITDEEKKDGIENKTNEARLEAEEDLKETLKSMLPEEDNESEDDEDFEFIDLN